MTVFTAQGRVAVAKALKTTQLYVAWGAGDSAWDAAPVDPPVDDTALVVEIGRRKILTTSYASPDANGNIITPAGKFSASMEPTNCLYIETTFDYLDSPGIEVREVGVFSGGATDGALPPGQVYFPVADVTVPGDLIVIARFPKVIHTNTNRQTFRFVISF